MNSAQKLLAVSGFEQGCPLATIALESTPQDTEVRQALALGFARIRAPLQQALVRAGMEDRRAGALAALIVSAYEGALLQARVAGRVDAMQDTASALMDMVQLGLPKP
jgi:TetR/AcrR family transcriptional repressor of lmrAB and yxaGH operons